MSADPAGEPMRRTDDDVLARLNAIDHRLHQVSTQLTTMGTLLSHLDEICTHLETLIGSLDRRVDRERRVPDRNDAVSPRRARPLYDRWRNGPAPVLALVIDASQREGKASHGRQTIDVAP